MASRTVGEVALQGGGGPRLQRNKLRALLVLRAKLTIRLFAAEKGRLFIALMLVVAVLPLMFGIGAATAIGYLQLPEHWPAQLLGIVLVVLWLAWMFIPVLAYSLNEGMDVTRLLTFPLSRLELIATMLLGTLFDVPTYIMLPLFIAIVVGWIATPAALLLPVALLLAYVLMVLSSQILITVLGGILASRRFRDVLIVLGALLGSSCYLLQQGARTLFERFVEPQQFESLQLLPVLRWMPGGSQAQSIVSAASGDWGGAIVWLGYGLLWAAALMWIWWHVSMRLITGEGFMLKGFRRSAPPPRAAVRRRQGMAVPRWLPADLQQLMAKELRLVWRTPQRRVGLLQGMLVPLVLLGYTLVFESLPDVIPPWLGLALPVFAIFTAWIAGQNALGVEEKGLPLILLTPLPRHRFWLGKSLINVALVVLPLLVLAAVALFLLPAWQTVVGMLAVPGATMATLAVNNLGSIFFAYPVRTDGTRLRSNTRGGCIAGIGNGVIMPILISVASAPIALLLAGSQLLQAPWLGFAGAGFSLIYGAAILYGLGVVVAGRLTLQREAELLAATKPPEPE